MTALSLPATPLHVKARLRHFVSRQVTDIELPAGWTIDEATRELVRAIELPALDEQSRPQHYELFLRRGDGSTERLPSSSTIGESVRELDELEAMPEVMPGGC